MHFLLSIFLTVLTFIIIYTVGKLFPEAPYSEGMETLLWSLSLSVILSITLFSFLTTYTNTGLTLLSVTINLFLWIVEQLFLEHSFHSLTRDMDMILVTVLHFIGVGFLWTTNKLLLDKVFEIFKINLRLTNRLDRLLTTLKTNLHDCLPAQHSLLK